MSLLAMIIGGAIMAVVIIPLFIYATFYNSITGEWSLRLRKDEVLD